MPGHSRDAHDGRAHVTPQGMGTSRRILFGSAGSHRLWVRSVELWATCSRVIGQTPSSNASSSPNTGGADGNRRLCLLNCLVDGAAGLFYGPVGGPVLWSGSRPAALSIIGAVRTLHWDRRTGRRKRTSPASKPRHSRRRPAVGCALNITVAPCDDLTYCRLGRSVPKLGFGRLNTGTSFGGAARSPAVNARSGGRQPCPPGCRPPLQVSQRPRSPDPCRDAVAGSPSFVHRSVILPGHPDGFQGTERTQSHSAKRLQARQ